MSDLEKEVLASLYFEVINRFKQMLNFSERILDSAFKCVIYAPFSRQASKEQHRIYVNSLELMREQLNRYFN